MFCNVLLQLIEYGKTQIHFLAPEETTKLAKRKLALTSSFQKVIRAIAFSGREKFAKFILF